MKALILLLAFSALFRSATAAEPIQLSIMPGLAWHNPQKDISGFRLGIWSESASFKGLDLNLGQQTRGDWSGLGFAFYNQVDGDMRGLQFAPFGMNYTRGDAYGWSSASFYSRIDGEMNGWQSAIFSYSMKGVNGLQSGLVSISGDTHNGVQLGWLFAENQGQLNGLQVGLINRSQSVSGLQLGLVNLTQNMNGFQVGLINVIENSPLPFFPFVNAKF